MPRSDSSSCFSGFKSGYGMVKPPRRERPQQLACDRCRGQKLRCIRTQNPNDPCERCQKAGATCIIDSSVRMGRPRRTDKEQRESTGNSHNPPQHTNIRSPALPTTSSQPASSRGFTPNGDTWSGHDLDDAVDPLLRGVTVQYLEAFDFALSGEGTLEDQNSLDIPPDHYLNSALDLSLDPPISALTRDEGAAIESATTANGPGRHRPMRQETMQELSDLNMQVYQQLGIVGPMASKYTNIHPGLGLTALATPPDGSHTLSDAVVFMMHGLQTYHRLLVEILGSGPGPNHSAIYDAHEHPKPSTVSASLLLSPAEGIDAEDSTDRRRMSEATGQPPRKKIRSSSNGTELTVLHDSDSSHSALLDMPSSLLVLSCHTNLMHLSRDAFAAIRAALLATHRQITLFTISLLHIDEVSIPPDPDLQIIVLTQAVLRLIDRIGRLLGCQDDCEVDSGGERYEAKPCSIVIAPQLVDLVLKGEAGGEGLTGRVGIEALREEIRRLHEIVYQPA
ncbi:uncharacterized protein E0L32_000508 [Thyridium curvatum]|uniref:Zn(2)-C6 fungal-type domain-containing protein n=1 Tax=Thyridium curvatum TaxID=1093900 RepID=A0A507B5W8_9PEZI|nr:uncharacterized protein E0L32_000508 [Thyridium curvatum]TPX14114.1 hypothetical protein E0L32_000508 [Thyridium curvatum]